MSLCPREKSLRKGGAVTPARVPVAGSRAVRAGEVPAYAALELFRGARPRVEGPGFQWKPHSCPVVPQRFSSCSISLGSAEVVYSGVFFSL